MFSNIISRLWSSIFTIRANSYIILKLIQTTLIRFKSNVNLSLPSFATSSANASLDSSSSDKGGEVSSLCDVVVVVVVIAPLLLPAPLGTLSLPSIPFPVPSALNRSCLPSVSMDVASVKEGDGE